MLLLVTLHLQLGKEIASPDADRDQAGDAMDGVGQDLFFWEGHTLHVKCIGIAAPCNPTPVFWAHMEAVASHWPQL